MSTPNQTKTQFRYHSRPKAPLVPPYSPRGQQTPRRPGRTYLAADTVNTPGDKSPKTGGISGTHNSPRSRRRSPISPRASPRSRSPRILKRDDHQHRADLVSITDSLTVRLISQGAGKFTIDFTLPDPTPPDTELSGLATSANDRSRHALQQLTRHTAREEHRKDEAGPDQEVSAAADFEAKQERAARVRQFEQNVVHLLSWIDIQLGFATKDETVLRMANKAKKLGKKARIENLTHEHKKKALGRTSAAHIAMSLENKLNALRHNPGELKRVRQRIVEMRDKERAKRGDTGPQVSFEERNMQVLTPAQVEQRRQEQAKVREERQKQVLAMRQVRLKETLHRRLFYFKANKLQRRRLEHEQLRDEEIARVRQRVFHKKWLILLEIAARQRQFSVALVLGRHKRAREARRTLACQKIQRAWRSVLLSRRQAEVTEALETLTCWFRRVRLLRGLAKKKAAANTIVDFLTDRMNTAAIVGVIRSFQQNVLAGQRLGRAYVRVKLARLHLLELQFDKVQHELAMLKFAPKETFKEQTRKQQLKQIRKRQEERQARWRNPSRKAGIPDATPKKDKDPDQVTQSLSRENVGMLSVKPKTTHHHIKDRLLREKLVELRSEFYEDLAEWVEQKEKWDNRYSTQKQLSNVRGILLQGRARSSGKPQETEKERHRREKADASHATVTSGIEHPGPRPYFVALLARDRMIELVQRGLDESAQWNRKQVSYRLQDDPPGPPK